MQSCAAASLIVGVVWGEFAPVTAQGREVVGERRSEEQTPLLVCRKESASVCRRRKEWHSFLPGSPGERRGAARRRSA